MAVVFDTEMVDRVRQEVREALPRSAARVEKDRSVIPAGTTRSWFWWPIPIYIERGEGARITDIDGRTYIDCNLGFGPLILGHCHPVVTQAVHEQVDRGVLFGPPNEAEGDVARMIVENVPGAERATFVGSGTEATMGALRLARAATGRQKVAKFEGGWHGIHEFLFHSFMSTAGPPAQAQTVPETSGLADAARDNVVVLPYNDPAAFTRIEAEADDLACVIIESVQGGGGAMAADKQFLLDLRDLCTEHGILLIIDEVVTGFRLGASGGSGWYGIEPDMVTLGKIIGGGLNAGAVAGRAEYLDLILPGKGRKAVSMGGTHAANPMSMTAGRAQLSLLLGEPERYEQLNLLGAQLRDGLAAIVDEVDVTAHVTGAGSMWGLHFTPEPPVSVRDQADTNPRLGRVLSAYLLLENVLASAPYHLCFLSTEHTEEDVEAILDAHRRVLARMKDEGWIE